MLFVFGIILFVVLIVVHEFGHFLVARRNGVEVEEFGVGFPPRAIGRHMGKGILKSYYSLNWLPLGGFVKLKGESDEDSRVGSFGATSLWVKTKITMAGVVMNLIAGAIIFAILSATGIPVLLDNQVSIGSDTSESLGPVLVGYIEEGSPASQNGLELEDAILAVDRQQVGLSDDLYDVTERNAGQEVIFTIERDGQQFEQEVTLNEVDSEDGFLGVIPYQITTRTSTWSAPINGLALAGQFAYETFRGLGNTLGSLFSGDVSEAGENVSGPVGIFVILRNIDSPSLLLMFIGLISITLAVMNAMPIPALDGGRLAVMLLFRALRKPLSAKREQAIHSTGMAVLLMLVALITVADVNRFF